jgi:hypothetical protein
MVVVAITVLTCLVAAGVGTVTVRRRLHRLSRAGAAARAGAPVNLAHALPRRAYHEMSRRLKTIARHERRRLVEDLATFLNGSPARIQAATAAPGDDRSLRLWFSDGWQIVLVGLSKRRRKELAAAAAAGLDVTSVKLVRRFGTRVRLRWTATTPGRQVSRRTNVQLAALQRPVWAAGGAWRTEA